MKLEKDFIFGNYRVRLCLSDCHCVEDGSYIFQFGIGDASIQSFGGLKIKDGNVKISTDVFSGKRIYYWQLENSITITDDVLAFYTEKELQSLERDEFEELYFAKHGYTAGDSTMYKEIKKIPPSCTLNVDERGAHLVYNFKFRNLVNTPDTENFKKGVFNSVRKYISPLKKINRPIVLCFSGGKDSTYLAKMMITEGLKFHLVFFKDLSMKINGIELKKAKAKAIELGLDLNIIDITGLCEPDIEKRIKRFNIFDRHYCRYHFYGCKILKDIYGDNLIIVNGQNADSIISYGPSEEKFSSTVKRYLMYGDIIFLKKVISAIIGTIFRQKLTVPVTEEERQISFYDNFKYCMLLDKNLRGHLGRYVKNKVANLKKQLSLADCESLYMYIKCFTSMQASDAQVVTQSGGGDLIMPFSTPEIIETTILYKNNKLELHHPKYALEQVE